MRATQDREKLLKELQALEHRSEADKKTGNYEQLQKKLKDKDSELVELRKRQKELEKVRVEPYQSKAVLSPRSKPSSLSSTRR